MRFGRPSALTPHQRQEAIQRLVNGEAQADIARSYAVSQSTILTDRSPYTGPTSTTTAASPGAGAGPLRRCRDQARPRDRHAMVAEAIETALTAIRAGMPAVWAMGSAGSPTRARGSDQESATASRHGSALRDAASRPSLRHLISPPTAGRLRGPVDRCRPPSAREGVTPSGHVGFAPSRARTAAFSWPLSRAGWKPSPYLGSPG